MENETPKAGEENLQQNTVLEVQKDELSNKGEVAVTETIGEVAVAETKNAAPITSKKQKDKKSATDKAALTFIILGVIGTVLAFIPLISMVVLALYYLVLFVIVILTLLTILLNENFRALFSNGEEIADVLTALLPYCTYIFGFSLGFLTLSLILYCFSKNKSRKVAGIVISILFMLFSIGGIVLLNLG